MERSRKLGRIRVSGELALADDMNTNRRLLFQSFHPYHIETTDTPGDMMYYGISQFFGEVEIGEEVPEYRALYHNDGEKLTFKFEPV